MQADYINAMKARDGKKTSVLRSIMATVKYQEIEEKRELNDEELTRLLKKEVKKLRDAVEAFTKGHRNDLATESREQLELVQTYLPPELSDEELQKHVHAIIAMHKDVVSFNPKAMIPVCIKELRDKADPARIINMVHASI